MSYVIKTFLHSLKSNIETQKVVASSLENHISSLKEQKIESKLFNFDSIDLEDIIRALVYLFYKKIFFQISVEFNLQIFCFMKSIFFLGQIYKVLLTPDKFFWIEI